MGTPPLPSLPVSLPVPLPLSLFAAGEPAVAPSAVVDRYELGDGCWYDLGRGWLTGGDALLTTLVDTLPWHQGKRLTWGQWLDEPRLSTGVGLRDARAPSVLQSMADALSCRYRTRLDSCFCNYYRDGNDSVAWHADREGRTLHHPIVAIVSLGGPRVFALRPMGGGHAMRVTLHSGDLLTMGGAMQHRWEHAVPKMRHAAPRLSVTFRQRRGEQTTTSPNE